MRFRHVLLLFFSVSCGRGLHCSECFDYFAHTSKERIIFAKKDYYQNSEYEHIESFNYPLHQGITLLHNETMHINSSSLEIKINNETRYYGKMKLTEEKDKRRIVAVFNHEHLNLHGRVEFSGDFPVALLSRSTIIMNTSIDIEPGTLGGFKPEPVVNYYNSYGPSSNARMLFLFTIEIFHEDPNNRKQEIQTVTTSAGEQQWISGWFTLIFNEHETNLIKADANVDEFSSAFSDMKRVIGDIWVARSMKSDVNGFTWTVTFLAYIGNPSQIRIGRVNLFSENVTISIQTLQEADDVSGAYALRLFGKESKPIAARAPSTEVEQAIRETLRGMYHKVTVTRSNEQDSQTRSSEISWTVELMMSSAWSKENGIKVRFPKENPFFIYQYFNLSTHFDEIRVISHLDHKFSLRILSGHSFYHSQNFHSLSDTLIDIMRNQVTSDLNSLKSLASENWFGSLFRIDINSYSIEQMLSKILAHGKVFFFVVNYNSESNLPKHAGSFGGTQPLNKLLAFPEIEGLGGPGGGSVELNAKQRIILFPSHDLRILGGESDSLGNPGNGGELIIRCLSFTYDQNSIHLGNGVMDSITGKEFIDAEEKESCKT